MNLPTRLRIGWIPYWNLYPLRMELEKVLSLQNLHEGHPLKVNQMLNQGMVDLAPCSSICLIEYPRFEMILPMGIACSGPVQSAYIGLYHDHDDLYHYIQDRRLLLKELFQSGLSSHPQNMRMCVQHVLQGIQKQPEIPLHKAPPLSFSKASETSNALARILYCLWFGPKAFQHMMNREFSNRNLRPIEMMIGDDALIHRPRYQKILDLGSEWTNMTGLPFVFGVWQSRGAFLNGWRRRLLDIGIRAETKMSVDPIGYLPDPLPLDISGKAIHLAGYWKNIKYRLGPPEIKGLLLFLQLARSLRNQPLHEGVTAKLLRWQELNISALTV